MKLLQVGLAALFGLALGTCSRPDRVPFGISTGGSSNSSGGNFTSGAGSLPQGGDGNGGTAGESGSGASGGAPPTTTGGSGSVSSGGSPGAGGSGGISGRLWGPSGHTPLPLVRLTNELSAYVPNRGGAFALRGSGHTHCAPDHSGIAPETQVRRLRELPGAHAHDFVWLTAHNFVAPDPGVSGIMHMFGVEVYTATLPSGVAPHMLAYLPDGSLANESTFPFGAFDLDLGAAAAAIVAKGGLPALAHPARLPPTEAEMDSVGEQLWGMEVTSGSSNAEENLMMVDQRLSRGRYVCLTAGGDIHGEDYRLTSGYQVVSVDTPSPDRKSLFAAVAACNMFACGVQNTSVEPLDPPRLTVVGDSVELSLPRPAESIRFVGKGGVVLSEYGGVSSARYAPRLSDQYVRVEAVGDRGRARCYSQPIWLVDETRLSSAP